MGESPEAGEKRSKKESSRKKLLSNSFLTAEKRAALEDRGLAFDEEGNVTSNPRSKRLF